MIFLNKSKFPLFHFRQESVYIDALEKEYGISLPPLYKLFLKLIDNEYIPELKYYYDKNNNSSYFARMDYYSIDDKSKYQGDYAFEKFYNPKFAFTMYSESDSDWEEHDDYMYIAKHGWGTGFAVGLKEHNLDKIFFIPDYNAAVFLEENIFKFISKFKIIDESEDIEKFDYNKLYRNYNEPAWRLR